MIQYLKASISNLIEEEMAAMIKIKYSKYPDARVLLWRTLMSRMLSTKANFPGRWSRSNICKLCRQLDTDEHLFICPGYRDLHCGTWKNSMFFSSDIAIPTLSEGAKILLLIVERLLELNEDDDVVV